MAALRLSLQHLPLALPLALHLPSLHLPGLPHLPANIDPGVVMLFVPLCLLMLAMLVETVRFVARGALPDERPHARPISHWQDVDA